MHSNMFPNKRFSLYTVSILVVTAIAMAACYNWLIHPHVRCLKASQNFVSEVEDFAKKSKTIESSLKIKQLDISRLSGEIADAQRSFFTVAGAQQFFAGLNTFAQDAHCTISTLTLIPGDTATTDANALATAEITAHHASISLSGNYHGIVRFLKELGGYSKKIRIDPFSISVRQEDPEKLECSLILTIYVINGENSKGANANG
jgi:hypothetical protein